MKEQLFDVPNLDNLSDDPRDCDELAFVFKQLAKYAHLKAQSLRKRRAGLMTEAKYAESGMEDIYKSLPDWARW